jgi:hypothetical protein
MGGMQLAGAPGDLLVDRQHPNDFFDQWAQPSRNDIGIDAILPDESVHHLAQASSRHGAIALSQ